MSAAGASVLVVTAEEAIEAALARLAAAAGVLPTVVSSAAAAAAHWSQAAVVLIGADQATALARSSPVRRSGVHIVTLGAPASTLWQAAVECGAETVLELDTAQEWLVQMLTDIADGLANRGRAVGVLAGSGGAGATVMAAALGLQLAASCPTMLMDTDPLGPGQDHIVGMEGQQGIRWSELSQTAGRLSARSFSQALPSREGLAVLTWPPREVPQLSPATLQLALSAAKRGFETVIVDLPRHHPRLQAAAIAECELLVVVTVLTVPGVVAASRLVAALPPQVPRALVCRDVGGGVSATEAETVTETPVWVQMANQRHLAESIGLGAGPLRYRRGPLARAAAELKDRVLGGSAMQAAG